MTGVFVGKLFYQNTAKERILAELPESSPVRQKVVRENSKRTNKFSKNESISNKNQVKNEKVDNIDNDVEENKNNKKYTTYEQLRKSYRKFRKSNEPFVVKTESNINNVKRKIKFNKYGDEIIEED